MHEKGEKSARQSKSLSFCWLNTVYNFYHIATRAATHVSLAVLHSKDTQGKFREDAVLSSFHIQSTTTATNIDSFQLQEN